MGESVKHGWKPSEVRLYLISNFAGDCGKTGCENELLGIGFV